MPQPRLIITDNWLTNPLEILSKVKDYTYSNKTDLACPVSNEGDVNYDWSTLRKFEKLLGYKILNWRDNETEIHNGSYIKIPHPTQGNLVTGYQVLNIGKPEPNTSCLVGLLLLNDLSFSLKMIENNEKKGEYELKGNRLILFPCNTKFIVTGHAVDALKVIPEENKEIYLQVFRFNIHTKPLDNNYWHRLDRQLTYKIMPCFTKDLCNSIIAEAESTQWTTARHDLYPTTDIPVENLIKNKDQINEIIKSKVFPWIEDWFGLPKESMYMNDLFVVKYSAEGQRKLTIHRDVSIVSFNVLLNEASEFEGGGTKFYYINKLVPIQKGEVLIHSGKLYHAGNEVTKGNRYIMVGFVGINSDMINHDLRKEIYKRSLTDEEVINSLFLY